MKTTKKPEVKETKNSFWRTIFNLTGEYRGNLVIAMIFSFVTGIIVAFQTILIKHIIDGGITNTSLENFEKIKIVAVLCATYAVAHAFRLSLWGTAYRNILKGLEGFLFAVRSKFFAHIQTLCMRFYDKTSSGELFNYIMGSPMANLKNFLQQFALNVPCQMISLIISLGALLSYDWLLTIITVIIAASTVMINVASRKKIRTISSEMLRSESEASKYINDVIHGSDAIKMYAVEHEIHTNFDKYLSELKNKGIRLSFTQWIECAKPEMIQHIGVAMIYFVGGISCIYRGLSIGELTAFVSSMGTIMGNMNLWFNINLLQSNAEASLSRINNILGEKTGTPETQRYHNIDVERASAIAKNKPCIEFKDVSFGYDNRKIFENFNCEFEYNKSFGLVGSSGSGKSTIIKLIMRLYEVGGGEVMMHGCNIKKYSLHDLRKNIGIVPQSPFIFQMSIMDNIRMARPDAPMQEIMNAMELARVHEFVNDLPDGWNTMVGDGGFGLSGGQKQRIAIARAILGKPDILIFDEATSALDNVSERHIQNAINELMESHTVIIVAHRLTTIKNVDKIFVFDKGRIVQEGNFDELKEQEGLFKNMLGESEKE